MPQALCRFVARTFSCLSRARESDLRASGGLTGTNSRSQYLKGAEAAGLREKAFPRPAAKIPTCFSMSGKALTMTQPRNWLGANRWHRKERTMKKYRNLSTALGLLLAGFFVSATAEAQNVDEKIQALEQELSQLKSQQ